MQTVKPRARIKWIRRKGCSNGACTSCAPVVVGHTVEISGQGLTVGAFTIAQGLRRWFEMRLTEQTLPR